MRVCIRRVLSAHTRIPEDFLIAPPRGDLIPGTTARLPKVLHKLSAPGRRLPEGLTDVIKLGHRSKYLFFFKISFDILPQDPTLKLAVICAHKATWRRSQNFWKRKAAIGFGNAVAVARRSHLAPPPRASGLVALIPLRLAMPTSFPPRPFISRPPPSGIHLAW